MTKELAVGVDIGGTNTTFGLVTMEGKVIAEGNLNTSEYEDVNLFIKDLADGIKKMYSSFEKEFVIKGIGAGAPNGNYYRGTIEFAPNLRWTGIIHFADLLKEHFDVPVILNNDAKAAAIGEMIYGAAKGMKDFILITLGTGLGSGFVANGEIIYGLDSFAGELGHTIVIPDGRLCKCGRKGCLERYASATGIVITMKEMLESSNESSKLRKMDSDLITSKNIFEAAQKGDKLALEAFDYTAKILGRRLSDAVAITEPEAIILFGGLALAGDILFIPTKKYLEEYLLPIYKNKIKLIPSQITGRNAAVLGASAMVWKSIKN